MKLAENEFMPDEICDKKLFLLDAENLLSLGILAFLEILRGADKGWPFGIAEILGAYRNLAVDLL